MENEEIKAREWRDWFTRFIDDLCCELTDRRVLIERGSNPNTCRTHTGGFIKTRRITKVADLGQFFAPPRTKDTDQ